MMKPNPGSDEAIRQGCACPVMDNGNGKGAEDGEYFWISGDCLVHDLTPLSREILREECDCGGNCSDNDD
jgi:hypothetical protein